MAGFGRFQAALYDVVTRGAERGFLGRERPRLLAHAEGVAIEIGAGTGAKRTGPFQPFRVGVAA